MGSTFWGTNAWNSRHLFPESLSSRVWGDLQSGEQTHGTHDIGSHVSHDDDDEDEDDDEDDDDDGKYDD